ncbi:class I SAM-dependent RNA methyltransferase, partial [Fulvivirga sp. RKSG066]|uniref:THUMP domain-containing class I SAM-dependent RNA methyltransferase n=1 Tax=Fulvivirga aurantia TaxID=2529383 RepID=UPI0012BBEAA0
MSDTRIVVNCAPKLASILKQEIEALGYDAEETGIQSVETTGSYEDTMLLNLHLRTATRVLYHLKSFRAFTPDDLYKELYKIDWLKYINHTGYINIDSFVKNDNIKDTRFANLRAKDAIVDKIYAAKGQRPDSGPKTDKTVFFLHWVDDQASIYINTSGDTITKHGYRKIPFKAPMMESLAAATILASRWDKKSHFVNPMCGSGTLAIEAALIATNRPPGIFRSNFGFMHTKLYDRDYWMSIRQAAKERVRKKLDFKIIASDLSYMALEAAKQNAMTAGVDHLIDFVECDFRETPMPEENGVIFFNPEYGQRLGEEESLAPIYQQIGDFLKQKAQGYFGYIFTGNLKLAKNVGLKTKRRVEFYNGRIDSRLLEYELYAG